MNTTSLDRVTLQIQNKIPFVLFSEPQNEEITCYFQKHEKMFSIYAEIENCFVFHPFDNNKKSYYIPREASDIILEKNQFILDTYQSYDINVNPEEKGAYEALVAKAILKIKKQKTLKIVVSRDKLIALKKFELLTLIERIFSLSKDTFRYVWYHPETGLWCGATPELLLKTDEECFSTMALAGTRPYAVNANAVGWSLKEKDEHQFVVDDIVDKLQKTLSVLKVSNSYTHRAGSVVHLRTDISGCFKKGKSSLSSIANILHPTPAVCGVPKKLAFDFIEEFEGYNREFYTGYLGCINDKYQNSFLYVNLRCMKLEDDKAHIFVGGGITIDSDPELEWQETEAKSQTMLEVLQPML